MHKPQATLPPLRRLRGARYQGERAFALMSQRWRAIRHVSADPSQIGDIAKSVLVLTQFEHKMIS